VTTTADIPGASLGPRPEDANLSWAVAHRSTEIPAWRFARSGMTERASQTILSDMSTSNFIHRSVSDDAGDWEYAPSSVRDMAASGLLFSRLA